MKFSELLDEYIKLTNDLSKYDSLDYCVYDEQKEERLSKVRRLNQIKGAFDRAVIIDSTFRAH